MGLELYPQLFSFVASDLELGYYLSDIAIPAFGAEGEGKTAIFSDKRWDRRNRGGLIESAIPCHDAQMVGSYRGSNPLHLTVLTSKSEDYTTAPQHILKIFLNEAIGYSI